MAYIGKKPTDKPLSSADLNDNIVTSAKILDGTIANADVNDVDAAKLTGTVVDARISALTASKLTGALPAISGAALTGIVGSQITSVGTFFENWNEITGTVNTTLSATAHKFLMGAISITGSGVWTITGTGQLTIL